MNPYSSKSRISSTPVAAFCARNCRTPARLNLWIDPWSSIALPLPAAVVHSAYRQHAGKSLGGGGVDCAAEAGRAKLTRPPPHGYTARSEYRQSSEEAVNRTYQPNTRKRSKTHGFRKRMSTRAGQMVILSLIHISEPTRRTPISYAVFCLKKKK